MRPTDYPRPMDFRPARSFAVRLGIVIFLFIAALQSISFYVESLWFESLGFESIYWYRLRAQGLVFLIFAGASAALLWTLLRLVIPETGPGRRPFVQIGQDTIAVPTADALKRLALPVAIVIGIFIGLAFAADWNTFALFFNSPENSSVTDPIFGKPLSFYLFTLPVMESIAGWLFAISAVTLLASLLLSAIDMSARFRGVSLGLSLILTTVAWQTYVRRYGLLHSANNLFTGIRYVDDNIVVPGLTFIIVALLLGAAVAAYNIRAGRIANIGLALAIPALTFVVAGIAVPFYVTTFIVRPNEIVRETPYIKNNIEFTRKAFGLDAIEEIPFEPRLSGAVFEPAAHKDILDNVRLWDWRALQSVLRQVQVIRTYYDFPDIDVDRYVINGKPESVMLGVREMSLDRLPAGSRNWVNERLIYTHGYGVTMNSVTRFTREGLPEFYLSNMPVESTAQADIKITRPEIYFGEITNWPVYVKTLQKEFNYAEGDANNYSLYEGTGGIRMGSFFRRLLIAWTVGDLSTVPFSKDITADSALLMRRNIRERVSALAPFLLFDQDPYIVVGTDGALYWIVDAFTASDRFPYARHVTVGNRPINYMRNSVKAVVDAYNGTVRFYVFDNADPLVQSYQKMFPTLFAAADQMPDFLRAHIRYPELLFRVQATIYATYHVENEQVFYNREDIWTVAQQGRTQQGQGSADAIDPFFVLMRFPGEKAELEFVSILPFTPANRNNLIGWMAGRGDGENYGRLRTYRFPKTRFVNGPLQVQAQIDQDPQLAQQLTLWNQQGSTVIRGNLLVLPLDDVLLFVEPIYLQAERSPMPELRLVVLATQDRLAYGPRFQDALNSLLQGQGSALPAAPLTTTSSGGAPSTAAPAQPPPVTSITTDIRSLVDRANQALADYRRLTAEGRLGEAGAKLDDLKRTLEEMSRNPSQTPKQ
jgi:uncharacterized membrane protein (UPF0182 family)